jgi:RNA polymerase sigma factor for flagellar operon FliA
VVDPAALWEAHQARLRSAVDPARLWDAKIIELRIEIAQRVEEIIPQAKSEAWRYFQRAPHVLDRGDLESIAFEGLCQAASTWEPYCAKRSFSPFETRYFAAYVLRRMRGAILDFLRASDWVTRSTRQRAKALDAAEQDGAKTDTDLAVAAGMSTAQVRSTRAMVAAKPVSLDEGDRDVPEAGGTESQAVAALVLEALAAVRSDLVKAAQQILALRYYGGYSLEECAEAVGLTEEQAVAHHDHAVRLCQQAMLAAIA